MIVELDVGGEIYRTTRETLEKCDYFKRMLGGTMKEGLKWEGRIFIDRDGAHFSYVLNYLRSGHLPDPEGLTKNAISNINLELDFFGLPRINPLKRKRDKDELKPFWYEFLLKLVEREADEGLLSLVVKFKDDCPVSQLIFDELKSKQRRDTMAKILRNDLNLIEDRVRANLRDREWILNQIKPVDKNYKDDGKSMEELRDDLVETLANVGIDGRWQMEPEIPRIEQIVISAPRIINNSKQVDVFLSREEYPFGYYPLGRVAKIMKL